MKISRPRLNRFGLTLIEVTVSTLLVATVLLVSMTTSANLLRNSNQQYRSIDGGDLARLMLDEISTRQFEDSDSNVTFGIEPDESATDRTTFDDIDDYHNYSSSSPTYRDGTAIDGFNGWTISVTIERANISGTSVAVTTNTDAPLRLATVNCTSPESVSVTRCKLISGVASDLDASTAHEKYRRVTLTFGSGRTVSVAVPLHNQPDIVN